MDKRYEAYCLADPLFYDHPAAREDLAPAYPHTLRPAPAGWSAGSTGDWWRLLPDGHRLPDQGWKIHVSATPSSAPAVLDALYAHCVPARLAFKHLRSGAMLFLRNSKYAERGGSGKFATLYPADEAELEATLKQLDDVLAGQPGPYILSDLRFGLGPLYVRYGGFAPRRCLDANGETVPAIAEPDGRLVPDRRGPVFAPPPWAALPDFLAPHLAARSAASVADLPYRIEAALHFSNGGGVYRGTDTRTGAAVVLKEARPHAGLLGDGQDAVARLEREHDALRLAAGSGAGPEVLDWVEAGEHRFLVLEHVPGRTLNTLFSERYPLIGRDAAPGAAGYAAWALGIAGRVEAAIDALHARGVVFNDLHLFNIMVRPDDTVCLIDFEVAAPIGQAGRQLLAARAFQAPRELSGPEVDRYALACLRLALFLPLTSLLPLDRSRARALADAVRGEFPQVPVAFLDEAVAVIAAAEQRAARISAASNTSASKTEGAKTAPAPASAAPMPAEPGSPLPPPPPAERISLAPAVRHRPGAAVDAPLSRVDWNALRASIGAGIALTATPEREDRLFPGDIRQFAHAGAGLGIAHGAAGVLYALHATGTPVREAHEQWLLRRAENPPPDSRLGFYDGVHGVAHVLDLLGHRDAALALLERALGERWQRLGPDLSEGLAGIGLNLLHFAERTGDAGLRGAAVEAGRLAVELLAQEDAARARAAEASADPAGAADTAAGRGQLPGHAGLLRGASGAGLLFVRLFEHTGNEDWLERARAALRMDLARCTASERDGSLRVSEGWRALPYLAEGSAGIALVARRYLAHREDEGLRRALEAIHPACTSRFYAQSGLFAGRAGLLLALADADSRLAAGHAPGAGTPPPGTAPRAAATPGRAVPGLPPRRGTLLPGTAAHRLAHTGPGAPAPGPGQPPRGGPDALDQLRRLTWHAVDYRGTLAFPGDQLHRLSADLATGAAGVLLALGAVLGERPAHLPFLGHAAPPRGAAHPGGRATARRAAT